MESQQKVVEKILSEKEVLLNNVGFIEDIMFYSDTFL